MAGAASGTVPFPGRLLLQLLQLLQLLLLLLLLLLQPPGRQRGRSGRAVLVAKVRYAPKQRPAPIPGGGRRTPSSLRAVVGVAVQRRRRGRAGCRRVAQLLLLLVGPRLRLAVPEAGRRGHHHSSSGRGGRHAASSSSRPPGCQGCMHGASH